MQKKIRRLQAPKNKAENIFKKPLHIFSIRGILFIVFGGMWHSLVARIVRDDEAAGSNPVIPTTL